MLLRRIIRKLVHATHLLSCWIPEAEWQRGQDRLWIQNAECGPLAHYWPCSRGYWQRRPGIWHRNRAGLFHVTEAQIHRQRAQPSMVTPAVIRTATRGHHLSQEFLPVWGWSWDSWSNGWSCVSFVHTVWSAWPPYPSEYLFYLQSSKFNWLKNTFRYGSLDWRWPMTVTTFAKKVNRLRNKYVFINSFHGNE